MTPKKNNIVPLVLGCLLMLLMACNSNYTSRKKGYFKIDLPEHQYQVFNKQEFPYSFEYI
jgi:hypothetical protein